MTDALAAAGRLLARDKAALARQLEPEPEPERMTCEAVVIDFSVELNAAALERREREKLVAPGPGEPASAGPYAWIDVGDLPLALRPEPASLQEVVRALFAAEGWEGIDALAAAVAKRRTQLTDPRSGGARLAPRAHGRASRGGVLDQVDALGGAGEELDLVRGIEDLLPEVRMRVADEVHRELVAIEAAARALMLARLDAAKNQVLAEKEAYGVVQAKSLGPPYDVYYMPENEATAKLREALDELARIRAEALEPAIRDEQVAGGVSALFNLTAVLMMLQGRDPMSVLRDPALAGAHQSEADARTRRQSAYATYVAARASYGASRPIVHRIAEDVDDSATKDLAHIVGAAIDETLDDIAEIRSYAERTAIGGEPPSADALPLSSEIASSFYAAVFRTVWSYPAVIHEVLRDPAAPRPPDSVGGQAARLMLSKVEAAETAITVSLLVAELVITLAAGPAAPAAVAFCAAAHVVGRIDEYATAQADFASAFDPVLAFSQEDPSEVELVVDVALEALSGAM